MGKVFGTTCHRCLDYIMVDRRSAARPTRPLRRRFPRVKSDHDAIGVTNPSTRRRLELARADDEVDDKTDRMDIHREQSTTTAGRIAHDVRRVDDRSSSRWAAGAQEDHATNRDPSWMTDCDPKQTTSALHHNDEPHSNSNCNRRDSGYRGKHTTPSSDRFYEICEAEAGEVSDDKTMTSMPYLDKTGTNISTPDQIAEEAMQYVLRAVVHGELGPGPGHGAR